MTDVREAAALEAESWLGTPYRHQASQKGQGADCLGLIRGVWRDVIGKEPAVLPPYTADWDHRGEESLLHAATEHLVLSTDENPHRGQVLLFRMMRSGPAKHCGIALSQGIFIHAYDSRAVCRARYSRWWAARRVGIFDFPTYGEYAK